MYGRSVVNYLAPGLALISFWSKKNKKMDSVHINDLPPPGIQHSIGRRTNLNPQCRCDITHLVDRETQEEVGGVVFDGLSKGSLQILQEHHRAFKAGADNVKRGNAFQKLDYGKMAAAGFCQPQGGAVGSGYGNSYKLSQVKFEATTNKVLADQYVGRLFKMALVCDFLTCYFGCLFISNRIIVWFSKLLVGRPEMCQNISYLQLLMLVPFRLADMV